MAVWNVTSRTVLHRSDPAITRPALTRFLAEAIPEMKNTDDDFDFFRADFPGPPPYALNLHATSSSEAIGDHYAPATSVWLSIDFDGGADDSEEGPAQARAEDLMDRIEEFLGREAPATYARAEASPHEIEASATALAAIAADHFGDPAIFRELIEQGRWAGKVIQDGVALDLRLAFPRSVLEADDHLIEVTAGADGAALVEAGAAAAQLAAVVAVESLVERLKLQLEVAPPPIETVTLRAPERELPKLFFGANDTLNAFAGRISGEVQWKDGTRTVVMAPQPGVRAELAFDLRDDGTGMAQTAVSLSLQSVGGPLDDASLEQWMQAVIGTADALAEAADAGGPAPSFGIRAGREVLMPAMRRQLAEVFPSNSVEEESHGFSIREVELAENVTAWINVEIAEVGEWDSQVTFTGGVSQGYDAEGRQVDNPAARAKYRKAVARAATEIERALGRTVALAPNTRPNLGMDL